MEAEALASKKILEKPDVRFLNVGEVPQRLDLLNADR